MQRIAKRITGRAGGRQEAVHLDHVILASADLEATAGRLQRDHGLASFSGGRHPAWGTANRIVPLGQSYLEILGVVDAERATESFVGTWIQQETAGGDRLVGWCVAADDIEETASRLGLSVSAGSRTLPDGSILNWLTAGMETAINSRFLPFFIQWDVPPGQHPGRMPAAHRVEPVGAPVLEISGDVVEVAKWLGGLVPWVVTVDGPPGVDAVSIGTTAGEVVLR